MIKLRIHLILVLLLSGGVPVPDAVMAEEPVHRSCTDCHGEAYSLKVAPVTLLCLTCHPSRRSDHPLVAVPASITTTLPLDSDRKMTCLTCHEPHGKSEWKSMLRKQNEVLCLDCHQK